jgi:hypothetical protein
MERVIMMEKGMTECGACLAWATFHHPQLFIMFQTGQKVACINDTFEPWVYDIYRALPKKDKIYTIRAIGVGRSNPTFTITDEADLKITGAEFDMLILLQELLNPDDPHSNVKQELGFRAERFAPLVDEDVEVEEEAWVDPPQRKVRERELVELH